MSHTFWNWARDEDNTRVLTIDGIIAEESWWGDEVTPKQFRDELFSGEGDIFLDLHSAGGDVIAASQIYALLMDYPWNVTVRIGALAASAASMIAMAGTTVAMAPCALLFIHNPLTMAVGDSEEMRKAMAMLDEVKEGIINAYELRTSLSRTRISHMMDSDTWLSANKAIELGFADVLLYEDKAKKRKVAREDDPTNYAFSCRAVTNSLLGKMMPKAALVKPPAPILATSTPVPLVAPASTPPLDQISVPNTFCTPSATEPTTAPGTPVEHLTQRLNLLAH